jgi:hypothetical protein
MHWMKHRWLLILPLLLVVLASCSSPAASTPQPTAFSPSPDADKLSADVCTRDESFSKGMGRLSLGRDVDWTIFCLGRNGARGACVYRHAGLSCGVDWHQDFLWEVGQGWTQPVTVRVKNLATGAIAW